MAGEGNPSGYAVPGASTAGMITGSGTANTVAKFTGAAAVGNSQITDNGTTVTSPNLTLSGLTASRIAVLDSAKALASNGAITSNVLPRSASSGATLVDSAVSDNATVVTISSNLIISGLTASQLVVSNGSKQLVSNGSITTNAIPKSASSGATLAASTISDTGTVAGTTVAWQSGRHLVSGFTPTVALGTPVGVGTTGTATIVAGSTDEAGAILLTASGTGQTAAGQIVLTFSVGSAYGSAAPICIPGIGTATGTTWGVGATAQVAAASTTAVTIGWDNSTAVASVPLTAGSTYIVNYICFGIA